MGWSVKGGGLGSHTELDNIGTKTHARIDTDLAALVMAADPRGKLPTQTLRADIDYAEIPALTRSGYIGIKVWIYRKTER